MQGGERREFGWTELAQAGIEEASSRRLIRRLRHQEACRLVAVFQDTAEQRIPGAQPENPLTRPAPGRQGPGDIEGIELERVRGSQER
jgi:hypothetical protein